MVVNSDTGMLYTMPGGRIATGRLHEVPRTAVLAAWLAGPASLPLRRSVRTDNPALRTAELRKFAARTLRAFRADLRVTGLDRFDPAIAYIVVPLHESLLDPLVVLRLVPSVFAMRSEFYGWRFAGPILRRAGQITVDPEHGPAGYRRLLAEAPRHLAAGTSVTVFAQGSVLGVEVAFSPAAFRLAEHTGAAVLPVVISGSHRAWDYPFSPRIRYGEAIGVEILEPIPANEAVASVRTVERRMKRLALRSTPPARRYVPERDGWWDGYRFAIDPDFPELASAVARHRNGEDPRGKVLE